MSNATTDGRKFVLCDGVNIDGNDAKLACEDDFGLRQARPLTQDDIDLISALSPAHLLRGMQGGYFTGLRCDSGTKCPPKTILQNNNKYLL